MGNPDRPELGERLTHSFCATDPGIAREFARVHSFPTTATTSSRINARTLSARCSADIIAPTCVGEYVHSKVADSHFMLLNATGHRPNLRSPTRRSGYGDPCLRLTCRPRTSTISMRMRLAAMCRCRQTRASPRSMRAWRGCSKCRRTSWSENHSTRAAQLRRPDRILKPIWRRCFGCRRASSEVALDLLRTRRDQDSDHCQRRREAGFRRPACVHPPGIVQGNRPPQLRRGLVAARTRPEDAAHAEHETAILREQFIAVLGHDLKNPLAALAAGVRMLQLRETLSDRGRVVVKEMAGSALAGHGARRKRARLRTRPARRRVGLARSRRAADTDP